MRIIKLKIFPVPVRLHSVYGKLILSLFHHFLQYLRTLYIVWSLVRRRVTRRLTRLPKLCTTLLNISKHFKTVAVRLRLIFQFTYVLYCIVCIDAIHKSHIKEITCFFRTSYMTQVNNAQYFMTCTLRTQSRYSTGFK